MDMNMYALIVGLGMAMLIVIEVADRYSEKVHHEKVRGMLNMIPLHHDHTLYPTLAINMGTLLILLESHQYNETSGGRVALVGCDLLRSIDVPAVN